MHYAWLFTYDRYYATKLWLPFLLFVVADHIAVALAADNGNRCLLLPVLLPS